MLVVFINLSVLLRDSSKPKDIHLTKIQNREKHQIFASEKLKRVLAVFLYCF